MVRSLDWEVAKGPLWKTDEEIAAENRKNQQAYIDLDREENTSE